LNDRVKHTRKPIMNKILVLLTRASHNIKISPTIQGAPLLEQNIASS
jgi:hypothetical protein